MINLNRLSDLLGNDKQIVSRFLDLYCEKIPELINKLGQQLSNEDDEGASITAHEIKSQSAYLGLDSIVTVAAIIEADTEHGKTIETQEQYEILTKLVNDTLPQLRAII